MKLVQFGLIQRHLSKFDLRFFVHLRPDRFAVNLSGESSDDEQAKAAAAAEAAALRARREAHDRRVHDVAHVGVRVVRVRVQGDERTRPELLDFWLRFLPRCRSVEQLAFVGRFVVDSIERTGCYRRVAFEVNPAAAAAAAADGDLAAEVTLRLDEKRFSATAEATVSGSDTETSAKLNLLNVTGRCDKVYFDTSFYNSANHRSLLLGYENPLLLRQRELIDARVFRTFHDHAAESAYHEYVNGAALKYVRGAHTFQYECAWREVLLAKNPTVAQFGDAGHTLKSSLRHQVLWDGRDSAALPTSGSALSLTHELAGLGGNSQFFKHETALQFNVPLLPALSFGVLAKFGAMAVPQWAGNRLSPSDRFYAGGPLSFAGFAKRGVGGASTRRAQLGGTAHWSVLAMLSCPVQAFLSSDVGEGVDARLHCFAQTGALAQARAGEWHALNSDLLTQYRTSVGVGVGFSLAGARLELNASLPLRASAYDRAETFQFGVAMKFI